MRQRWTLNVENFGKIEQAKIELKPMMLFVGDNNSGKSYLMSLLWGILQLTPGLFSDETTKLDSYKKCEAWLDSNRDHQEFLFDEQVQLLFVDLFNEILALDKEKLASRIFNFEIGIGRVFISDYSSDVQIVLQWHGDKNKIGYQEYDVEDRYLISPDISSFNLIRLILVETIVSSIRSKHAPSFFKGKPLYLPASRTGFMLAYKSLVASLIDTNPFNFEDAPKSSFSFPITRFLQWLVKNEIVSEENDYSNIAKMIEQNILRGEIQHDQSPMRNYLFKSQGSEQELPLYVTSSLVSELTPIILALKSSADVSVLIIEEPEAHLHLEMQKMLATALVRLVNHGMVVWMTTHSQTIFQQINNLIKLHNHPNGEIVAEKHGYSEVDRLDPSKVSAYQFSVAECNTTQIGALKRTPYGFAVPTFNKTIADIRKETLEFQEFEEDEE